MATADVLESTIPNLQLIDFRLPPPRELSDDDRAALMKNSVARIWTESQDPDVGIAGTSSTEMWMLLIVRMVTRVAVPPLDEEADSDDGTKKDHNMDEDALESDFFVRQDRLRQTLCDYIMADFPARCIDTSAFCVTVL